MQFNRKLEIVEQAVKSISTHDDADGAVRVAALDRVIAIAQSEKDRVAEQVKARIEAALA